MTGDSGTNRRNCAIVVDELALVRAGIGAVLTGRGLDVVADTRSGRELVSLATVDRPEVVVVGVPADLEIVDTVRRLVRLRPHPAVAVLLPPAHDHLVRYLVGLGAAGVGLRSAGADELGDMVDVVRKGDRHVSPALHSALTRTFALPALDDRAADVLSSRETRGARTSCRGPQQP